MLYSILSFFLFSTCSFSREVSCIVKNLSIMRFFLVCTKMNYKQLYTIQLSKKTTSKNQATTDRQGLAVARTYGYCILHSGWSPAGLEAFSFGASGPRGFRCLVERAEEKKSLLLTFFPKVWENMLKRINQIMRISQG